MPISEVEGRDLKEGLKKLPQEVKTHILKKATRSIRKLEQLGHSDEEMAIPMGLEPTNALRGKREGECPMLVGGVCSVYDHRPIICRVWGYPIDNGNELACCHMTFISQRRLFKPIDYAGYWRECRDLSETLGAKQKTANCYLVAHLLTEDDTDRPS
jgi:Fe-S-cluster containining protein